MRDRVYLIIGGKLVENFASYSVESNLFVADDAFRVELADPEAQIDAGQECLLYVNDELELNGIIDRISESYDKSGRKLTVEGRDLMGLLVDSYCEEFITLENISLTSLAERLLKNVPFINRKNIIYGKGNKNRAVPLSQRKEDFEFTQIEPGQTVFDVLKDYALSRGMLFFSLPDGTLVFGEPLTSGKAEFTLTNRKDGRGNNILNGDRTRDISKRYSRVVVTGQKQGADSYGATDINVKGTVTDPDYPFYKPFVATAENDGRDPKKYARVLMEKQQFDGYQLGYKTFGHSQNGKNYQVNAVCHVEDEVFSIGNDFLIYGRVFEMSREGVFTTLRLSRLGVLPA